MPDKTLVIIYRHSAYFSVLHKAGGLHGYKVAFPAAAAFAFN
jgi:hypothetical protein